MPNRPSIDAETKRQVFTESGHRCAVCGDSCPLERAHIIPWSRSADSSAENLICLCASCHERADNEKWGEKTLREYKRLPWVRRKYTEAENIPQQTRIVKIRIDVELQDFDQKQRRLLQHALAGFLEIPPDYVCVTSVTEGSTIVSIELPEEDAQRLLGAYQTSDPELLEQLAFLPVLAILSAVGQREGLDAERNVDRAESTFYESDKPVGKPEAPTVEGAHVPDSFLAAAISTTCAFMFQVAGQIIRGFTTLAMEHGHERDPEIKLTSLGRDYSAWSQSISQLAEVLQTFLHFNPRVRQALWADEPVQSLCKLIPEAQSVIERAHENLDDAVGSEESIALCVKKSRQNIIIHRDKLRKAVDRAHDSRLGRQELEPGEPPPPDTDEIVVQTDQKDGGSDGPHPAADPDDWDPRKRRELIGWPFVLLLSEFRKVVSRFLAEDVGWQELGQLAWDACDLSQKLCIQMSSKGNIAEADRNEAQTLMARFVVRSREIAARPEMPKDFDRDQFDVYIQNVDNRANSMRPDDSDQGRRRNIMAVTG